MSLRHLSVTLAISLCMGCRDAGELRIAWTIPLGQDTSVGLPVSVSAGPDRTVLVADVQRGVLHRWSLEGNRLSSFGTPGRSPGSSMSPSLVRTLRDTIMVWDRVQQRVTLISHAGSFLGMEEIAIWPARDGFVRAFMKDGNSWLLWLQERSQKSGLVQVSSRIIQARDVYDTLSVAAGPTTVGIQTVDSQYSLTFRSPFNHRALVMFGSQTIIGLSSLSDSIAYPGRSVLARKTLGLESIPSDHQRQRAYRDSSILGIVHLLQDSSKMVNAGEGQLVALFTSFLDTVSLPSVMPTFYSATLDSTDHLWVLVNGSSPAQLQWMRYNLRDTSPPKVMARVASRRVVDAFAMPHALVTLESDSHGESWIVFYE